MARVFLHPSQGMRLPVKSHGNLSDDEDGVQSGSATGFSDGEEIAHARPARVISNAFDPVNRILDKIDAELSSLTHSQGSSSTATDSTVVRKTPSHESTETSRLDSGSLTISQLGPSHKPSFSPLSSGSKHTFASDKDTGIGTATSSLRDSHHRSRREEEVRSLEPGEGFRNAGFGSPGRSNSPDLALLNGHHGQSDDDKSKREHMSASYEAKQVDDKFKEIMQKRKGGFLMRASTDDDNQTIRTEDFADKFQDTLIYPSSDEAERLRNIEEDLHSDGGSDTDTLQQKLVSLTQPHLRKSKAGQAVPRPLPRPQRKLGPLPEIRPRKVAGPGTPPVYPKPTPTNTLPRPSTRSSIKFTPGHTSDADSVRTEDFENQFKDMMVTQGNQPADSDADTVSNDPIHAKVKELLKATAKYAGKPLAPVSNSILKSQLKSATDKPKTEQKSKQHVRISAKPPQYQDQNEGDDSDDTLCSEKDVRITSHQISQHPNEVEALDETHKEIERETDRIRREMERERRSRSQPAVRERSPTRTYLSITSMPKSFAREKPDAGSSFSGQAGKSLSDEEKEKSAELKATQNALEVTQNALVEARKSLKETEAMYEDARTKLMLSEYKKENNSKELARISDDLKRKRQETQSLEREALSHREELQQFSQIGFTKQEAIQIIEENESMKSKLRNLDTVHAERDELIQQLDTAKQELFHEQKKARERIEELKEEMETMTSNCDQLQTEKDEAVKKMAKIEGSYRKMEKEKNELVQEKTRLYEEERDKNQKERHDLRKKSGEEVEGMRKDLVKMANKLATMQDELRTKDEINGQLRDQLIDLQQKTDQEKLSRASIVEEHKKTLQSLRKETDSALVQMRESLFLEKQKTMDTMRTELDQERRDIMTRAEERYESQLADQAAIIKAKNEELTHLVKLVDKLETEQARNKGKAEQDLKLRVQEALEEQKKVLESEKDETLRLEKETLTSDFRYKLKQLQDELTHQRQEKQTLENKIKEVKDELEDYRSNAKSAMHEKLVAIARAKELMRQEHQAEIERITEQMRNEHKKEIDKLRETIRVQEEELRQLRDDRKRFVRQQKETNINMDRTERTLINEINEECRKTSEILGLSPRKVNINSYRDNGLVQNSGSSAKAATTSALRNPADDLFLFTHAQEVCRANEANLRACNEELRTHVSELQHSIDQQRNSINMASQEKEEALANLKRQLEREKEEEIDRLKKKLVKGLSTNEYRSLLYSPENDMRPVHHVKPPSYDRQMRGLSEQQQLDLDRLEQEVNRLAVAQDRIPSGHETAEDMDYAKKLADLQMKVRQLKEENSGMRRVKLNVSSSTPDLSNPDLYSQPNHRKFIMRSPSPTRDQQRLASTLELKAREHDIETEILTEHQRRNREIMSRKMSDMSRLQNTLTNQAKELIQLEKAYTQLNKYAKVPRPRSSLR